MCRVIHSLAEDMTDENGNNIGPQTLVLCNEWAEECNIDVDFVEDEACKLIGESVHRFIATYPIVLLHVGCDEHSEVYEMFTIITDMMRVCAASEPMADQELTSVIARWPMIELHQIFESVQVHRLPTVGGEWVAHAPLPCFPHPHS